MDLTFGINVATCKPAIREELMQLMPIMCELGNADVNKLTDEAKKGDCKAALTLGLLYDRLYLLVVRNCHMII